MVTRTTFALGLAIGLGALLALIPDGCAWLRCYLSSAPLASPVAGLFLGVAGGALFLSGRRRAGVTLAVSALVPTMAVGLAFGNGGRQTFAEEHALMGFLVCLAVAGLCWRLPVVRWGALLSAVLVAVAYFVPTPVGTTATRLPELFAAPIIVAVAAVPLVAVIAAAVSVVLLLPPVSISEVRERGDPALSVEFYAPLLDQLALVGLTGPLRSSRRCGAAKLPSWRRWLRPHEGGRDKSTPPQQPHLLRRNPQRRTRTESGSRTTPSRTWPSPTAHTNGRRPMKRTWCAAGCRTYKPVWSDQTWTLYAVTNPRPVISFPGRVIARSPVSLTVSLPEPGEYVVRVRWSRYLSTSDGCMRPTDGWVVDARG